MRSIIDSHTWSSTLCLTHYFFCHRKSRWMVSTHFIKHIGLILTHTQGCSLIWLQSVYSSPLFCMYCIAMSASCCNNGSGVEGELPRPTQEVGACSFPSFWRTCVCIEETSRKKDWPSGMLNWKTAFLATPVLSHFCRICCHFAINVIFCIQGKELRMFFKDLVLLLLLFGDWKSPGFEIMLCIYAYWHQGLALINLIYGLSQTASFKAWSFNL